MSTQPADKPVEHLIRSCQLLVLMLEKKQKHPIHVSNNKGEMKKKEKEKEKASLTQAVGTSGGFGGNEWV